MAPCLESESLRSNIGVDAGVPAAGEGARLGSLPGPPSVASRERVCVQAVG